MLVVCAKLKAKAGKEKEVEEALKSVIGDVQNEPGTLSYVLHRSVNHSERFLFYERYRDTKSFENHIATPYFKALMAMIGPLLEKEPNIDLYEEIASIDR